MKKILTTIIFILLCIMLYFTCFKGISLGNIHISSVTEIKQKSIELDEKKEQAIEKTNKEYPSELNNLKESISSLNIAKDKYNEKALIYSRYFSHFIFKTYTNHYCKIFINRLYFI